VGACVCVCSICICTIKSLHWLFFCLPEFVVYEIVHGHCVFHCSCSLFAAVVFQGRDVLSSTVSSHGKPHGLPGPIRQPTEVQIVRARANQFPWEDRPWG
jgi:hypothetical protein